MLTKLINEKTMSTHLPYSHLINPFIAECVDGKIMSVIAVEGVPFDTENDSVIMQYKQIWHDAITRLDDKSCVYVTTLREKHDISLKGDFSSNFLKKFDQAYHAQFKQQSFYKNRIYITIMINGISEASANKKNVLDKITGVLQKANDMTVKNARNIKREKSIKLLQEKIDYALAALSKFSPRLLGKQDNDLGYSELLYFIGKLTNVLSAYRFRQPKTIFSNKFGFDKDILQDKENRHYPKSNLAQYLTATQVFFGDYILFKSATGHTHKYGAMLSIKNYPNITSPFISDKLLTCDCEFILSNSFFPLDNQVANKMVERQRARLNAVGSKAYEAINDLTLLESEIASERAKLGLHQMNILILGESKEAVDKGIFDVSKKLQDGGVVGVRETIGAMAAFWSLFPGNQKYMARLSPISSENFADFSPLHNYRLGFRDENFLGSAVTVLTTPSKTPFFFNFHAKGSKTNPSKGHYIIIGGNDSGKTATIAGFDAQFSRYGGRSVFFDRDRGLEIYVKATGGYYSVLTPNKPENSQFNPLQLDDTPVNRQYCREWLALLVKREGEEELPVSIQKPLDKCIHHAFEDLDKTQRKLSNITRILPVDFERWDELKNWLHQYDGKYSYIFDNDHDVFAYYDKMGFDLTHFLNNESKSVLAAVMHYLFYRIETGLDGSVTHCVFDEGWQMLEEKLLRDRVAKHLATGRKKKLFIGIGTQSLKTIANNPISHSIVDNIATGIFFSNANAKSEYYCDILGLTESEFGFVKDSNPAQRLMLIKQGKESTICKFNLSSLDDALAIFSANETTIRLLDAIIKEVGDNPDVWLPEFHKRRKL